MMRTPTIAGLIFLLCMGNTLSQDFDAASVTWSTVTSKVRWLNFYQKQTLLTLSVDGFDALKKLKSGQVYDSTKFPPGSFSARIADAGKKKLENFSLTIANDKNYTLVTMGNPKEGMKTEVFEQVTTTPPRYPRSRIRFVNAVAPHKLAWRPTLTKLDYVDLEWGGNHFVDYDFRRGHHSIVRLPLKGEHKMEMNIVIPPSEKAEHWLVICHLDGISADRLRLSYLNETTNRFHEAGEQPGNLAPEEK